MIRFYLIYVMCGIGCLASLEVNRPNKSTFDHVLVSFAWPAVVTASIIHVMLKDERK